MIRSYTPKQDAGAAATARLELVRNPHFRVWSPAAQPDGYPDRIVLETGYTDQEAVARVTDGRADLLWSGAPQADVDRLETRYGSQLHTSAGSATNYVFLNATKPPFDNRDARRAVAYALDRGALTSDRNFLSGPVTCQLIPPDFAAYQPYCPFTLGGGADGKWTGPDLATAQDLVQKSGTRGAKVVLVVVDDDPALREAGERVVAAARPPRLPRLVARAAADRLLRSVTDDPATTGTPDSQGWGADYPAASNVPARPSPPATPTWSTYNLSGYCDPEIDKADRGGARAAGHRPRRGERRLGRHRPDGGRRRGDHPVRQQRPARLRQPPGRQRPRAPGHRPAHRTDVGPVVTAPEVRLLPRTAG